MGEGERGWARQEVVGIRVLGTATGQCPAQWASIGGRPGVPQTSSPLRSPQGHDPDEGGGLGGWGGECGGGRGIGGVGRSGEAVSGASLPKHRQYGERPAAGFPSIALRVNSDPALQNGERQGGRGCARPTAGRSARGQDSDGGGGLGGWGGEGGGDWGIGGVGRSKLLPNGKAGGWTRGFGSTLPKQCSNECAARTERRDPRSTALPSTTLGTGPFDFAQGKQGRPPLRSGWQERAAGIRQERIPALQDGERESGRVDARLRQHATEAMQ